jgi:hypothetical protein
MAMLRGGLAAGLSFPDFERGLSRAALAHYAAFGHCMIYVTKAGRLIERFGDRVAEPVLLSLARHTLFSSREDQIPEFRHYAEALASWGKGRNGTAPEASEFKGLNAKNAMKLAARHGKSDPEALYRALLAANADNMLHYDMAYQKQTDLNIRDNVGWLDFTHTIAFANAARKTCAKYPELCPMRCCNWPASAAATTPIRTPPWMTASGGSTTPTISSTPASRVCLTTAATSTSSRCIT